MAINKMPYPAFVKILYHSRFAPHVMIVPTKGYLAPAVGFVDGSYVNWEGSTIDAGTMIVNYVTLLAEQMPPSVQFDYAEYWTKSSPSAIPILVHRRALGLPGTSALVGWDEAVQRTYFLRSITNGAFKIILLDTITDNQFSKNYVVTPAENLFLDMTMNAAFAFQARDGAQPNAFRALTITLNERLRRSYHLR